MNFIIRAIDDVLKDHFGLPDGIADTSKIKIKVAAQEADQRTKTGRKMYDREVHKVQLLDVATGTGTFLAEAVKQIYRRFEGQEGLWDNYVENDLLPRLHGFELLMASYAMCHMKLDLLLRETGYDVSKAKKQQRLSVYLTNSLEEDHKDSYLPFTNWLSNEANQANEIKRDMPIMVAFGNPPYEVKSKNRGRWIQNLIADYKKGLNERKINLDDDYIKFIRYAEHYVEKTGYGIVAMITNNSFLSGVTHRKMRKHLLETFDNIYIYDLHGNSKQKETAPDGSKDENVFDIQQGVSISIFIKNTNDKKLGNIYHYDSYGKREKKYQLLQNSRIKTTPFICLTPTEPYYFFVPKNFEQKNVYEQGFSITEIFVENNTGIQTKRDKITIHFNEDDLKEVVVNFQNMDNQKIKDKYDLPPDGRDWKISLAQEDLRNNEGKVTSFLYRPFDIRKTYFTGKTKGFLAYPRTETMRHFFTDSNIGLVALRINQEKEKYVVFCTNKIIEKGSLALGNYSVFPLYLYQKTLGQVEDKAANFNSKIFSKIKKSIPDVTPETLFDYIYAVLHSAAYRVRYAEFLKIDFPRIPYPKDHKTFHALAEKGATLRELHLMESPLLDKTITTYPIAGGHEVKALRYDDGKVWINETQYFGGVPDIAWNFYIGGYQPAQKWLKDRKGRNLTTADIKHYQRIIIALTETDRIMKEIDAIKFLPD